ncbi:MAG: GNAT family N-acetyltransferase [Candidatus Dormibacteria bacterium]
MEPTTLSPVRSGEILTELHSSPESWLRLRVPWLALQELVEEVNPFLTWQWQEAWWRAYGEDLELRLFVFRVGEEVVAIAPLCVSPDGTVRFCGGTEVSDYLGMLCRDGHWHAVGHALLSEWQEHGLGPLDLHFLCEGSATLEALTHASEALGLTVAIAPEEVCPRVELPATWDEYLAGLDRKDRHELRRKQRRLEGEPGVRFAECCEESLQRDLDDFIRLHRLSSAAKAEFLDDRVEAFFRDSAEALHDAGWLSLRFVEVDRVRVAAILSFVYRDRVYLYNSGYDPAQGRLSAGLVLIAEDIRAAIAAGRHEYDFLRGSEPYKYDLGAHDRALFHLRIDR